MPFKPNYRFERMQRTRDKDAKKAAKQAEKAARKAEREGTDASPAPSSQPETTRPDASTPAPAVSRTPPDEPER